jgi:hypothetical protein
MIKFWTKKDTIEERRRAKRLKVEDEVTITIVSGGETHPKGKVIYNNLKDISVTGAKIQANIFLPVDALLEMDITIKDLYYRLTALGKVKWIKNIVGDESYEAGVEFVSSPRQVMQKLADYISWKLNPQSLNPV